MSDKVQNPSPKKKTIKIDEEKLIKGLEYINENFIKFERRVQEVEKSLDNVNSNLERILATLESKNLNQELPAINHDEETLKKLAEFGTGILKQLEIAARWYARELPNLEKNETTIKNLNATHEQSIKSAVKEAEELGRKTLIKDLLGHFDVHSLFSNPELSKLAAFLQNNGVETVYQNNDELEITEDNRMQYENYIAGLQLGKIIITAPAYVFDKEVIAKATFKVAPQKLEGETSLWGSM